MSKTKYEINKKCLANLKTGQVVDSYKELCLLLGMEPEQGGNSRKKQRNEIERYISIENITRNKIKINEIYLIPLKKIDNRKEGNNSVYIENVSNGLIIILKKCASSNLLCSRGFLAEKLGFINKNYKIGRNYPRETCEYLKTPEDNLLDFYSINQTRISKAIETSLKHFRRKSYCIVESVTIVCLNRNSKHRVATPNEKKLILKAENLVKEEIGIEDDAEIFYRNMWKEYNNKVKEKLQELESGIKYYYNGYDFQIDRDKIEKVYQEKIKANNITLTKIVDIINKESTKTAHESIGRRQENAKKRISENSNKKIAMKRDLMLLDENAVKYNKKHVNNLISTNAKSINKIINEKQQSDENQIEFIV